jgi:Domain of unknown function (DUF397)
MAPVTDNLIAGSVEVDALPDGGVFVRAGTDEHDGPVLTFTREEWVAFVAGIKNGEFDAASPDVASPDR